nr:fibrillarin-like rRNA/tRNA 2'-O-methyltransferase [Candidatus Bathyarchaeota archaeon]NIV45183.1 fibrillarin-like rRNA/tRNA 2'-O-methyltransferase [Candidatus Bathyarchaeota archaeon]
MVAVVRPHSRFPAVYTVTSGELGQRLATKNLAIGRTVYGERLAKSKRVEYRVWDPYRSKLAAAIANGLKIVPIKPKNKVLY